MSKGEELEGLFQAIDARDADDFAGFLAPDCRFRFANADPVQGRETVVESVRGFFGAVQGMVHTLEQSWSVDGHLICQGEVCYTRHDGSRLKVPFANIFRLNDRGEIEDYRIYCDNSALFD